MNNEEKELLENQLSKEILWVMIKHINTGYRKKDGMGEFLDCTINFKYQSNLGGAMVRDLIIETKLSKHTEK